MKTIHIIIVLLVVALTAVVANAKEKGQINLFCWSEYVPQSVIDGFTKETGIKVNVENYASNEEMLSKLQAGAIQYDLIQPSEYIVERLVKAGKLEPIDFANVPNFKNILPEFKNMPFDPESKYSVVWMAGTVGIVVNTEVVKDEIKTFKDVFQPKFKGRIVTLDDAREMVGWALKTESLPINDITPATLEKVKPILQSWIPLIKVYDSDSPKDKLLGGDVDLGIVWSGEAALCFNEDKKFKYVLPAEGTHLFIDNLAIPKGSKNKANAEKFIDYVLRPEVSKIVSDEFPYTNPNGAARKLLSAEQLGNPASYPPKTALEVFSDIGEAAEAVDKMVTDLKSAN